MSEEHHPEAASPADEVINAIAAIEMQRQETEKGAGLAMACSAALHRLRELLEHETEALRLRGLGTRHQESIDAVKIEIERVKKLASVKRQGSFPRGARSGRAQVSWQDAPRNLGRNKGRRTMGRSGGR